MAVSSLAAQEGLVLTGEILGQQISREDARYIFVELKLRFTIRNKTDRPIIFVGEEDAKCHISYRQLFSQSDPQARMYGPRGRMMYRQGGGRANPGEEYRTMIRRKLDVDPPPSKMAKVFAKDETMIFTETQRFLFNKVGDPSLGIESWSTLVSSSPLDLYLSCEGFPRILDREPEEEGSFGRALRARWNRFGYLWLGNLTTAPIVLDLRTLEAKSQVP